MRIDPEVFNSPSFTTEPPTKAAAPVAAPAPVPVAQAEVLRGTAQNLQAQEINTSNARERAGMVASFGAAASEWSPFHVYEWATAPKSEPDPQYNGAEFIKSLNIQLGDDDREFLLDSHSLEEAQYKLATLERARSAYAAMGDNPVTGFIGMALDPLYLGLDVASGGGGLVARSLKGGMGAQRLATGVTAGASTAALGVLESQVVPMSDAEIIGGALLNGAAAGATYSRVTGRVDKIDPEYPSTQLQEASIGITRKNPDIGVAERMEFTAPDAKAPRTGVELLDSIAPHFQGGEFDEVLNALRNAPELADVRVTTAAEAQAIMPNSRGYWARQSAGEGGRLQKLTGSGPTQQNLLFVREGEGVDVPLHELTHAVIQNRMLRNPKMVDELKLMQENVVSALHRGSIGKADTVEGSNLLFLKGQTKDLGEFIAYSLTSPSFRKWAKATKLGADGRVVDVAALERKADDMMWEAPRAPKPLSLWDRLMDTISSVFGVGRPRMEAFIKATGERAIATQQAAAAAEWKSLDARLDEMLQELQGDMRGSVSLYSDAGVKASVMNNLDSDVAAARIDKAQEALGKRLGNKLSWSLYKTLASFSPEAREAARVLVDDPLDMAGDSAVSQARAIRATLADFQYKYEDLLKQAMATSGAGIRQRITSPREALRVQQKIERDVAFEMFARERADMLGLPRETSRVPKEIAAMADSLAKVSEAALKEMQAAGVQGADEIMQKSGYFNRRWDVSKLDDAIGRLVANGAEPDAARKSVVKMLAQGMRRANAWDAELAYDVAKAIVDRTHRKGYFEDSAFRAHAGNDAAKEVRDILTDSGISGARLQRALDVLVGKVDEAGKAPILKHRIDIDYKAGIRMADGSMLTVADLIDTSLTRITDQYLDTVAGRSALARKGLGSVTKVDQLRTKALESIKSENKRAEFAELFDDTMNSLMGRPTGEKLNDFMRGMQAATRMVGLASSGLWQVTESAVIMARYGGLRTFKHMLKAMPGGASLFGSISKDKGAAMELADVLSRNSSADIRLRPFVQRMEDNFEVSPSNHVLLALQQAQQLVPYLNAQKFVQQWQARVVGNLVTDTFLKGARGDVRAAAALEKYGLEAGILNQIKADIKAAGTDTAKWSDGTWAAVRGPLMKMMDDSVLRARTGEIPAFAQFSQVGKFVFTFRSFVLASHNKVMAGTLHRDGLAGMGLLLMYQMPLAALATAANGTIQGKPPTSPEDLIKKSFGQLGSIGLFSELWGVATGSKQQFGAPGLIFADRLYKATGDVFSGDAGAAASGLLNATPILSIIPGVRAIGETLKE